MPWGQDDAERLAQAWVDQLPPATVANSKESGMKGRRLICINVDNPLAMPDEDDVKKNALWVSACMELHPSKSPSGYLIADALLEMNIMLNKGLYSNVEDDKLTDVALEDAAAIRKMCTKMRTLFRNSPFSRCPILQRIKNVMTKRASKTSMEKDLPPAAADPSQASLDNSESDSSDSDSSESDSSEYSSAEDLQDGAQRPWVPMLLSALEGDFVDGCEEPEQ